MTVSLAALALGVAALVAGCGEATSPERAQITALPRALTPAEVRILEGSNAFAMGLLREGVAADADAPNVFLSPLSASMALGMTMNGADGETRTQMRDMLGFQGLEEQAVNEAYRGLIDLLLGLDPRVQMGLGNSVWSREGYPVLDSFYDRVRTWFDAEVREVDFADPATKDAMNAWVEEITSGRIEKMVEQLPANLVMVLLNAVYFKGDWRSRFDPANTTTGPFTTVAGATVSVPLMRQTASFRTFATARARGIELPYGGDAFTAVAVLPAGDGSLSELVAGLDADAWAEWTAALDSARETEVSVVFPRFELEYEQVLNATLQALGMTDAFGGGADFSRMVAGGGVWVDEVKQKTFLKVDEVGTEAAAATSVTVIESAPPELRFDRPFLFAIRERLSGVILFIGTIGDPSA